MPRAKPTLERKSRSGPTVPEDARLGTRMNLRLDEDDTAALDALTRRWGIVRTHAIARAIREALERKQ